MKYRSVFCTAVASGLIIAAGCKKASEPKSVEEKQTAATETAAAPAKDPNEVVASVNDTTYLRKDMDKIVDKLIQSQNIPPDQLQKAREFYEQSMVRTFVLKTLVLGEAKKENITVTDEDRKAQMAKIEESLKAQNKTIDDFFKESPLGEENARKDFEDGLIIDKLLKDKVFASIKIEDADIQKVIADVTARNAEVVEKNKDVAATNALKRAQIEALKKQLDNGADFAELAKANSDCPSKEKGGDLGEFTRGQMVKPFEDAAFSQEIGKVGDIVETPFGFHLIKVTAKTPAQEAKGDEPAKPETVTASHILISTEKEQKAQPIPTQEQVENYLKQQKQREAVKAYLDTLKASAKITTAFPEMSL